MGLNKSLINTVMSHSSPNHEPETAPLFGRPKSKIHQLFGFDFRKIGQIGAAARAPGAPGRRAATVQLGISERVNNATP